MRNACLEPRRIQKIKNNAQIPVKFWEFALKLEKLSYVNLPVVCVYDTGNEVKKEIKKAQKQFIRVKLQHFDAFLLRVCVMRNLHCRPTRW
jgi:hypothetical protein